MHDGGVDTTKVQFIDDATHRLISRYTIGINDVFVSIAGTVGMVGRVPASLDGANLTENAAKVSVTDPGRLDPAFLAAFLQLPVTRQTMLSLAGGAAQPKLALYKIEGLELPIPPIATQRKIAAILSAYDDLIENNNRRIKLLEETARRLYREWFVDFRYPGHENVPLVDSELGPIPEGWSADPVGDHAAVIRGRSYRGSDVVNDGGIPFINLKCIARDGGFRRDGIKRYAGEFKDAHKVRPGDIVMAVTDMTQERRLVARAARVPDMGEEYGVVSMDLVKILPKDVPPEYLLGILRYSDFPDRVKAHANGANVLHLHPDRITDYVAPFAAPATARHYSHQVAPVQHLSDVLEASTEQLRAARDLLLPRLISGKLDVTDLGIAVPDVAG
jgi:type I restriction enzyme S subunit